MSIIRVGSNEKYASGWDKAFGGAKKSETPAKAAAAKPAAKKKAAPKKAAKKAKK